MFELATILGGIASVMTILHLLGVPLDVRKKIKKWREPEQAPDIWVEFVGPRHNDWKRDFVEYVRRNRRK